MPTFAMPSQIFWCLLLSMLLVSINTAAESLCSAPPLEIEDFQPQRLERWLHANEAHIQSPKDFLCCVPAEVRQRFAIAHTSIAAQNGDANNPRVIFFHKSKRDNHNPDDNNLHFAFSINSGRSHLNNHNSVEFVYSDQTNGELSYFDLEISEKHKGFIAGKNPEKCMACHGTSSRYGPKPLLTDRPWHNFVSGHDFRIQMDGQKRDCNPVSKSFIRQLDLNTMDALIRDASDKRLNFSCMELSNLKSEREKIANGDVPVSRKLFSNLIEFDNTLRHNHRNRAWRDMHSHELYDRLKYLMIGAELCPDLRLSKWVPPEPLRQALAQIDYYNYPFGEVDRRGRYKMSLGEVILFAQAEIRRQYTRHIERRSSLDRLLNNSEALGDFFANSSTRLFFGANPAACFENDYQSLINKTALKYGIHRPYLTRIEIDNVLRRESSNSGNHPILRLIMEGFLKFPSRDLNMSLYNGVSSSRLNFTGLPILSQEPATSPLQSLFEEEEIDFSGLSNDFAMTVSGLRREQIPFLVETPTWQEQGDSFQFRRVFVSTKNQKQLCHSLENLSYSSLKEEESL